MTHALTHLHALAALTHDATPPSEKMGLFYIFFSH